MIAEFVALTSPIRFAPGDGGDLGAALDVKSIDVAPGLCASRDVVLAELLEGRLLGRESDWELPLACSRDVINQCLLMRLDVASNVRQLEPLDHGVRLELFLSCLQPIQTCLLANLPILNSYRIAQTKNVL